MKSNCERKKKKCAQQWLVVGAVFLKHVTVWMPLSFAFVQQQCTPFAAERREKDRFGGRPRGFCWKYHLGSPFDRAGEQETRGALEGRG